MKDLSNSAFASKWIVLKSFSGAPQISSKGRIGLDRSQHLWIEFVVSGPFAWLHPWQTVGRRQDGLWESDCFECFWEKPGGGYFELNVSPKLDWQIYQFESERQGRREASLEIGGGSSLRKEGDLWHIRIEVSLQNRGFIDVGGHFQLANVLCVGDHPDYLAFHHRPERPDFHQISLWKKFSEVIE